MSIIDNQVLLFSGFSDNVQQKLIRLALQSYKVEDIAYIRRILNTDISNQILIDLGMADAIDGLIEDYGKIIAAEGMAAPILRNIPPEMLGILQELDTQFYFEHVRDVGMKLKSTLIHASIGGITEAQLRGQLLTATKSLSKAQIGSLTNTALRTMSRATFASGASVLPDTATFHYAGPYDDRNRDICRTALDSEPSDGYTRDEISALEVDFVSGGGFNCRHSWELVIEQ